MLRILHSLNKNEQFGHALGHYRPLILTVKFVSGCRVTAMALACTARPWWWTTPILAAHYSLTITYYYYYKIQDKHILFTIFTNILFLMEPPFLEKLQKSFFIRGYSIKRIWIFDLFYLHVNSMTIHLLFIMLYSLENAGLLVMWATASPYNPPLTYTLAALTSMLDMTGKVIFCFYHKYRDRFTTDCTSQSLYLLKCLWK